MFLKYNPGICLPSAEDLPDSDDTPVDNELQEVIPSLLKSILAFIWGDVLCTALAHRFYWFFGVDMGIYYHPDQPAIVPDGFLSIGVQRIIDEDLRYSYVLWEEHIVPILILEVVSSKRRGEYKRKKLFYQQMEVLYYVIYNPHRRRKSSLEVYKLINGSYSLLAGNPIWLDEIGLAIGTERATHQGIQREWLYWYDREGDRYLTPEERAIQAEQQAQKLAERLRSLGIDPDSI